MKLPSWLGLYIALSVCIKMDNVFVMTTTVRVCWKVFPPVPCTASV